MAGRTRRTRMYDCNYNMGQQYYQSALDNLDRKKSATRESVEKVLSTRPKINVDDMFDEDLQSARRRAERTISEDAFFDSRGARIPKSAVAAATTIDDDIDEEVQASLNRIRANKKITTALSKDLDFEDTISTVKRRARLDLGEKLMEAAGDGEAGESIRRRAIKMVTKASDDYVDPKSLTKWTAINDGQKSAASMRAKATKARLNDLETEMFERSEKQQAREKRSAQLKKFLMDSDIETTTVTTANSSRTERHVNF